MSLLQKDALAALVFASAPAATAQVPPPPLLAGQEEVAEKLVHVFVAKDEAGYAALLADDLQVFEDGKVLADKKSD